MNDMTRPIPWNRKLMILAKGKIILTAERYVIEQAARCSVAFPESIILLGSPVSSDCTL